MTQEDDDLEEELRCLDIREDHGAEESDVTPTNTPPLSPPPLYVKKYPPPKPLAYQDTKDFGRYSRGDDNDCRSDSSLSWGEDEFEGEATRQVSILFDQLDSLLYPDGQVSALPKPASLHAQTSLDSLQETTSEIDPFVEEKYFTYTEDNTEVEVIQQKLLKKAVVEEEASLSDDLYSAARFAASSSGYGSEAFVAPKPTTELLEECSTWLHYFPHFRARGRSIEVSMVGALDQHLSSEEGYTDTNEAEEILEEDGDISELFPLISFQSANYFKNSKEVTKTGTSNSRVCSGSSDPEVLKEQVLIMLFDKLWPTVTDSIEPLLHLYAKYVIEQSVQYSSLSREPSTRGARVARHTPVRKQSDEFGRQNDEFGRQSGRYLQPLELQRRPESGSTRGFRVNRPLSAINRPSSAANRLQGIAVHPSLRQTELTDLLHVSRKPLQSGEERLRSRTPSASTTRESSARSSLSSISLPSVTTPRRPVSSRTTSHLLTPMRVDSISQGSGQRPASTSSYNSRYRFQEKFNHLSRQGTIQELGSSTAGVEDDEDDPHTTWSRHTPFLPPIAQTIAATLPKMANGGPVSGKKVASRRSSSLDRTHSMPANDTRPRGQVKSGDGEHSPLTVRGTMVSRHTQPRHARPAPKIQSWGPPIANNIKRKIIRPEWK